MQANVARFVQKQLSLLSLSKPALIFHINTQRDNCISFLSGVITSLARLWLGSLSVTPSKSEIFRWTIQGHPGRMRKVNHVAEVFVFIKVLFPQLFLVEK